MIPAVWAAEPPQSVQQPPLEVAAEIWKWLQITLYIVDACAILAVISFGALMVLDRERGEAVSATTVQSQAIRIGLGVLLAANAVNLALWFA